MSTLESISIQGIRSYHPDEKQTLKFYKPLTLILGQNGCGKTTIIECLKYITCSDLPRNANKGGFVWDPKLSDHHTVKGNVKLSFHDTKDTRVVVSKTLESTQKLATVSTKSLDQTISRKGQSTSHKCADLDDVMCTYLGVSKSILKDVVFCHQEDSNWPLDEDKKVKEKFDSIFDVGKYDKCIKQIQIEIKATQADKRTCNNNIQHFWKYREEARNKRATLENKKFSFDELQQKLNSIDKEIIPLEERYKEIMKKEEHFFSLKNKLLTSEGNLNSIRLAIKDLKLLIKLEFKGNDSDLDEELKNFNNNLVQKEKDKYKLNCLKNDAITNENKIQENMSKEQVNLGRYQSEEKQNLNNINKQNAKIIELGNEMQFNLPDLTEYNRVQVISNLSNNLSSMNDKLESTQKEHREIENKLQSNIDSIRVEKAKLDQEIKIKEKQILENTSEIQKLKKDIDQVRNSAEKLSALQKSKVDIETKLNILRGSLNVDDVKKDINKKKDEKYEQNIKLEVIEKEVQKLQLLSIVQAELDTVILNKTGIDNKLKILKNKVNDVLKDLLGFIPQEKLKFEFTSFLDKLSDTIRCNRKSIAEKQKQLTTLEANYNHTKEKLRTKQIELSNDENALSDMCQGQEYETILKEVNEKVEELQAQKGSVSTSGHLFRRYIKNLEAQDPSCPLCHRCFGSIDEVTELINDLNMRVHKIPSELETTIAQLETLLKKQSKLQQLRPTYTRISVLKQTEIPNLKDELERISSNLRKCRDELTKLSDENGKLETNETNAKNIQSDIIMIDSFDNDVKRYSKEEQRLTTKMTESGSIRNLQEAISERNALKSTINEICNVLEKKQYELNEYTEMLHNLQTQQNKITSDELNIKSKMQDEKSVIDKLNDLQNLEATISLELDSARETLGPIQEKLDTCINTFEQTKKQQSRKIENNRKEIIILEKKIQEINNLQSSIDNYEKKEWTLRIKETNNLLNNLNKEKMNYIEEQKNLQKQIDSINEYNANQEVKKIDLENNKKLRQKSKEEIECLSEINKFHEDFGTMDVNSLLSEKSTNTKQRQALAEEKNKSLGRKQELDNIIRHITEELTAIHFKNAENIYLHEKVQLEILNRVEKDLTKYNKALEWAMNRFHKERMQSINTIIKKLWRDIYTGNDIDYIQIKTSSDDKPIQTDTIKKRVFNYRVVQIKNEVELDMRGRCSAGQKVLACLIVRMALAETFSKNCGILALDEPTTNLDESNIQSLAESLSEIITRRSSQKSFQLLIITHDPNFLRKLSARDMVDTYYEVKRSNEGMSIVCEQDIKFLP
ncbi:DNA repair protein RAD50 isoform X3 [Acyrthosiphon pisum]|nr:DNA repair protein RAD50 isoform X3 [Acyrthosiphon pisum]XP_029343906.1 DNA repair protein RAD50 isoform X3 [Acyrthosiphon pisum]